MLTNSFIEIQELTSGMDPQLARIDELPDDDEVYQRARRDFEQRYRLTAVTGRPSTPVEEQADILTDLVEESDRLIRLVNALLVLARADAGQCLKQEPVRVRSVIEEACRQARQMDSQQEIVEAAQCTCSYR